MRSRQTMDALLAAALLTAAVPAAAAPATGPARHVAAVSRSVGKPAAPAPPAPKATTAATPKAEHGGSGAQILGAVPEPETGTLERMRQEREAVLSGTHFTYDPAGRRDPFRSLVENVAIKRGEERPRGIAGMLISETDLVGIIDTPQGEIAFVNGSDNRGYFLRPGEHLYDGTLIDVDRAAGRVVFRQKVDDPREIKPWRDVVKKLYTSTEEGE
jgi:nucleoid-associated protein YgaU